MNVATEHLRLALAWATATAMGAALVCGCKVNQAAEVKAYREVLDLSPTTRQAGQPLTLRDALLLANQYNENLSIEGEGYLRALIGRHRTAANFLPTVDLAPTYVRRDPVSDDSGDDSTFDVPAVLDWNLFDGFRDVNRYWRDSFVIEERRLSLLSFQELLLLDVARVYFQVRRSEASVRVLENSLTVQDERLRFTRGQFEAGRARPLDVVQTEAQVSATRTLLINARRDVRNGRQLLVLLTGQDVRDAVLVDRFEAPEALTPLADQIEVARQSRHDLLAADAAIRAARREVEVAFGQYYPSVTLNLSAFLYRETVPTARDWIGILEANLPLFSAGRIEADVREAWSFARQALLVRSFLDRQVVQQVSQAYEDLLASQARVAELGVRLAAAQQAFDQAEASYRVGLATNLDRIAAQDALLDAQLQLSSEEFDRRVFYLVLLRSTGLLREELESGAATARLIPATRPTPATAPTVDTD